MVEQPSELLDEWERLFANLVSRHAITGLRAFSRAAFEAQLRVPGLVMFKASIDGEVVGLDLWYVQGDVAYGHLVAFSDRGYDEGASYATKWTMLEYFAGTCVSEPQIPGSDTHKGVVRWVDLAGTAGDGDSDDGLAQFKAGWSTGTKPVYLCGRILQHDVYDGLTRRGGGGATPYFPAYRDGELT